MFALSGCSSDGGGSSSSTGAAVGTGDGTASGTLNDEGIDTGIAATATTVAGKVTLSSVVTAKARKKAMVKEAARYGKPGTRAYHKALAKAVAQQKVLNNRALPSREAGGAFSNGTVHLYNASHPEWKYPIAETTTDAEGAYTLETLINAAKNGDAYTDGAQIPGGNYTLLAFTVNSRTLRPKLVALQAVVSEFAGTISGIDLVAQTSDAVPKVTTMLGVAKNTDGTQTWGDASLELAPNAAVQVSFSMAMNRQSLDEIGLVMKASDDSAIPAGVWTLSADWFTATYYLNDGVEWGKGVTYTVTVNGADAPDDGVNGSGEDISVFNVFGKSMKKTSVATFTVPANAIVDTQSPTAQLASPTLAQTAGKIEITTPIRIASNERMDVNGLRLRATPSLGAQPGVLFVGKDDVTQLYVYEFLLGEPMKLSTTYDLTVSGGKDLAGNQMNELTVSFSTVDTTAGVLAITADSTDEEKATAQAQADVIDVFGKWVRSFSDRNLPQLQSLMSGDFFMEYNTASGFNKNDVNRDGVYDLGEFGDLMAAAFVTWDFCGVTLTGEVGETINIVGDIADFKFTLTAKTANNSQECKSAAPDQSLFATLQKINGAWYMVRASDGIDTRGQEIQQATLLALTAPEDAAVLSFYDEATETEQSQTFSWSEVELTEGDVASYAMILIDSRNPQSGFALILPPTMTEFEIPGDIDTLMDAGTIADVSSDFGFTDEFDPRDGAELYWQIAALGSNTVSDVSNERQTSLPKDVVAISELWRFKIAGEYQELEYSVSAGGADQQFSELIWGYDVGDAAEATITFSTPREGVTDGQVVVDGNTHREYPVTFTDGTASATVKLNQGINRIGVMDGTWDNKDEGGGRFIEEWFQIVTTGGIKPVITIDSVDSVDAAGVETALVNDGWDWYESTDAVSLVIEGNVADIEIVKKDGTTLSKTLNELRLDVWNDDAHARATRKVDIDDDGTFSVEVEIFAGENWVGVHGQTCVKRDTNEDGSPGECSERADFNANFGIATDAGSEYVPPIDDIEVTDTATEDAAEPTVITQKEDWGDGGMWDASTVTDNTVTISGYMEFATDSSDEGREPRYNVGSDGGWQSERLSVALDGTFSFDIDLFNGWNFVEIEDVSGNRFNLDILTTLGNEVVRPTITTVNGAAFVEGDQNTTSCSATLAGTAMVGDMHVFWNGDAEGNGERNHFFQEFNFETSEAGAWEVTVPLIGSPDSAVRTDNFVDIFDQNWNWMGVRFINTGDCGYTPPEMNITDVVDDSGNDLAVLNDWSDPHGGGGAEFGNAPSGAGTGGTAATGTDDTHAFPMGSKVVKITAPLNDQMDVGATTITGKIDPALFKLDGTKVARLMIQDPFIQDGPPLVLMSSRSDDSVQSEIANFPGITGGTFTVDATTGDFSIAVTLDPFMAGEISVMVWNDHTLGMKANPEHGYFVLVNGAPPPPADGGGFGPGPGGGDNSSVATDTITIEGTSNVAGHTITFELFGCGGVERYTATAGDTADSDGNYAWVSPAITVYQGHNNIGVSNGPMWFNVSLNATNNIPLPDPVLAVSVTGATKDTFGRDECGHSNWNAGSGSTVTITGTSESRDGQGEWRADGAFGRFEIVDGAFSFEVALYNGNNHIGVNDAEWNHHNLNIQTTGGTARPQFVALDTTTFAAGTQTVSGTIYADPAGDGTGFKPDFVGGGMDACDSSGNCMWQEFSTDPNAADWGALPMTLTPATDGSGNYQFSFTATFDGNPSFLNIWADGKNTDGMWAGHGIETPINDTSCSDCTRYWKPGKATQSNVNMQWVNRLKAARSKGNH